LALLLLGVPLCTPVRAQTEAAQPPAPAPIMRGLALEGVTVFTPAEIRRWLDLSDGSPLPASVETVRERLERRYHREGYDRATVAASFDESQGRLRLTVDEGRIDAIEVEGGEGRWRDDLISNLDVHPGDVYNEHVVSRSVHRLLEPTQGAIIYRGSDLVDRGGRRVLVVQLDDRRARFRFEFGTDQREDWYSPVDGFAPAAGFDLTIFDRARFHHTYIRSFLGYKFARESSGYSVGFERPIVGSWNGPRLSVGAEVHELTGTDDAWRLTNLEQSVVALTFANTFRDYHDRQGYQVHGAFRFNPAQEIVAAWQDDDHEPLENVEDYSFFRDDEPYRPNQLAASGNLRALVLSYVLDTRGLEEETLKQTFERHLFTSLFGTRGTTDPGVRVEWISELAPEGFGGDFDFTRHVLNARGYFRPGGPHGFRLRGIVGSSSGELPPQRQFALGGIGSVHGYSFKEAAGEGMVLFNAEYRLGSQGPNGARLLAFFDAGRVWSPIVSASPDVGSDDDWLNGIGGGFEIGLFRVEFGWRLDDIPKSLQVLVRFGPTF
jgi:hypothetical protein